MRMTSHNHLDNILRWRAVGMLEAGRSQAEVAFWLYVVQKRSPGYGINSNRVVLSPERLDKVSTKHRHLHRVTK
ncbi:hypothetical protein TNCV_3576541 [Trichonephila clavipes]|nr:hypothetical protein TNCV_3576541 [Trichonephila clavipes]